MVARHAKSDAHVVVPAISVDAAAELVAAAATGAASERIELSHAVGRVLAADLASLTDVPNCNVSAMDGYACRAVDTGSARSGGPVSLRVVGDSPAGRPHQGAVGAGEAVAVYTGAPIPEGADAIVRVEDAMRSGDTLFVETPAREDDIRSRAEQLSLGTIYLRRGTLLSPRAVLLAGAMGHATVEVAERPRVAVVVTGDEVVEPGADLSRGQVFNANGPALVALVERYGGIVTAIRHATDDRMALRGYLQELSGDVDLFVTSGGASAGRYDVIHSLLTEDVLGTAAFTRVLVRPGGPVSFGSFAGVPLLALPGNPAAAIVMFQVLGPVWFHRQLGRSDAPAYLARTQARAAEPFRHAKAKVGFWPALHEPSASDGAPSIRPVGGKEGPEQLQQATCLAITAPWRRVAPGGWIEMMSLD